MLLVFLVVLLQSLTFAQALHGKANPKPNILSLWNFGRMGKCVLKYNPFIFNHYGCWCGSGGGYDPIDELDKCCMIHDKCYDAAVDSKICSGTLWQYVAMYKWKCVDHTAFCEPNQDACKAAICACDQAVVNCWSKQPQPRRKKPCHEVRKTSTRPPSV
ncbi:phospholipase A2 [Ancylostoma caninum]|uniref:Phospholipase A2 n=1 Tax=Ancylostoma caninum TaxID=29170 RepID=A0A368G7U3_ANCCA|nr:phospholipase A2 [Ancylostoma caninum]